MKTLKLFLITVFSLFIAACNPQEPEPPVNAYREGNTILINPYKQWTTSKLPAYIGNISSLPAELQEVIRERFPHQVSKEAARVLILGKEEAQSNDAATVAAANKGAFVVYPGDASGELPVLLYCRSNWGSGQSYVMYDEAEVLQPSAGSVRMTSAEWNELVNLNKGKEDDGGIALTDYDNDADHNKNYYQTRMDPFVAWLDRSYMERDFNLTLGTIDYDNMKADIEQMGQRVTYNFPFTLSNIIDQATFSDPDWLTKSGSVSVDIRIFPLYMQSSNGDKAGDYYGVVYTVTPHNQSLWGPYVGAHGWCRNRIYGYWFSGMDVETSLKNLDGSAIQGLEFFDRPIPENPNSSKSYSKGKSTTLSGTISGGYTQVPGWGINGAVSLGGTWTSSTNYTLETINYMLDSSTPSTKYHYWTENVKLTDDWDDWNLINQDYPAPVRSEFSSHSMWVWYVPGSVVKDGSTIQFQLSTKIKLQYSSWYHWRGSVEYDSNLVNYGQDVPLLTWTLDRPDRTPWGFVRLRNATSNEMAHVSYYVGEDLEAEPVAQLTTSFGKGDEARIALPEGTYSITWDIINGDTGERLGRYIYRNVQVHQGRDEESATLRITTIDGEPL